MQPLNVLTIGVGAFGLALSTSLVRKGHKVTLWGRNKDLIHILHTTQAHPTLFQGKPLPSDLRYIDCLEGQTHSLDLVVIALSGKGLRPFFQKYGHLFPPHLPFLMTAKTIDAETGCLPSELLKSFGLHNPYGVLGGAHFAQDIYLGKPAEGLIGCSVGSDNLFHQSLAGPHFSLTCTTDVKGVEWANALKNVVAIKGGITLGQEQSKNAHSLVCAQGFHEMISLGQKESALQETFLHTALLADFMLTTHNVASRNTRFGMLLGEGKTPDAALKLINSSVEGIFNLQGLKKRFSNLPPYFNSIFGKVFAEKVI